jgi:Amt family ammonium transporter
MTNTVTDLSNALSQTQLAMNLAWVLLCGFLIMFMQAGFAMVETGLTRSKNAAHTMAMNFMVYSIGLLAFWSLGFGLQMGGVGPLTTFGGDASLAREWTVTMLGKEHGVVGLSGFMLPPARYTPAVAATFLFQAMFMATACTIPTGALAERWRFSAFMLFSFMSASVIYPVYANWVWGGGFLATLGKHFGLGHGHVDFAGSSVVHLTGGTIAAVAAKMLGPRHGKYGSDRSARPIVAHSMPLVVCGTFVLAFGWFGFNAGSTLSALDTRTAVVAVNTMLASAAGSVSACIFTGWRFGRPDLSMMCNGMLAGLVSITASCAFVTSFSALAIGAVAGVLVVMSTLFVEHNLRIDDPVGAISVHGANGMWGIIALGLFADGSYGSGYNGVEGGVRGLLFGDEGGQLLAGLTGIGCNLLYVGTSAALCFWLVGKLAGNRASLADEIAGLDVPELGMEGYSVEPVLGAPPPSTPVLGAPPPSTPAPAVPTLTASETPRPERYSWPATNPSSLAPAGAFSSEIGPAAPFPPFKTHPGT